MLESTIEVVEVESASCLTEVPMLLAPWAKIDSNEPVFSTSFLMLTATPLTRVTRRGAPVVVVAGKALLVVWGQEFVLEYALLAFLLSGE